jgi:hypothetical protein
VAGDSGWQAWFGGRVVDGLCEVLDEYLEEHGNTVSLP